MLKEKQRERSLPIVSRATQKYIAMFSGLLYCPDLHLNSNKIGDEGEAFAYSAEALKTDHPIVGFTHKSFRPVMDFEIAVREAMSFETEHLDARSNKDFCGQRLLGGSNDY